MLLLVVVDNRATKQQQLSIAETPIFTQNGTLEVQGGLDRNRLAYPGAPTAVVCPLGHHAPAHVRARAGGRRARPGAAIPRHPFSNRDLFFNIRPRENGHQIKKNPRCFESELGRF
jgi:hypothetical protein